MNFFRVLLCDDNKSITKLISIKLQELGCNVVGIANDGEDCLKMYSEQKPNLLLLDVTMPNMDGREVLAKVLEIDKSANVIMVSAVSNEDVFKECIKLGAKDFIQKSEINNPNKLKEKLELLNLKKAA